MDSALLARTGPAFSQWQRSLAVPAPKLRLLGEEEKAALRERQKRLLAALGAGAAPFGACLREAVGLEPGERIGAPPFPRPALSPGEFPDLPAELELEIAAAWDGIVQPGPASTPLFWLLCHIEWIEQERFGADILPAFFTDRHKDSDGRTRDFLRRSGGIYVRGNVSAHSDCPLSRAWWRTRIAAEAASDPGAGVSMEQAHAVLRTSRQVWEKFVELALKQVVVISQPRARAALISALARRDRVTSGAVQEIAQALARHGLVRSLQHTAWGELHAIAAEADGAQACASVPPGTRGRDGSEDGSD